MPLTDTTIRTGHLDVTYIKAATTSLTLDGLTLERSPPALSLIAEASGRLVNVFEASSLVSGARVADVAIHN